VVFEKEYRVKNNIQTDATHSTLFDSTSRLLYLAKIDFVVVHLHPVVKSFSLPTPPPIPGEKWCAMSANIPQDP
jgi:hypothetical protein